MRCMDCSSQTDLSNRYSPKPQINRKAGYQVQEMNSSVFRLPRANCILIDSEKLINWKENMRVLAALRQCSVIITKKFSEGELDKIMEELEAKAKKDHYWKPAVDIQILQVDRAVFRSLQKFIDGKPLPDSTSARSIMLAQLYQNFDFVQEKIHSKEKSLEFVLKFMKLPLNDNTISANKDTLTNFFRDLIEQD